MRTAKAIADGLVRKYGTRDPFKIVQEMGFIVVFAPLVEIRGFQQHAKRRRFIYINSNLDEQQQRFVCAHELAHHLMHKDLNRIFMNQNTYLVTQKFENQANQFAADLLYSDDDLMELGACTTEQIACTLGIPPELAEYRIKRLRTRWKQNRLK